VSTLKPEDIVSNSPEDRSVQSEPILASARQVLQAEAMALEAAQSRLGEAFVQAVATILQAPGKVVVCGLGKSGHVGRKIAATLASTGTSAFFLHPAEALHGDLGMLTPADCLLAIAFGGETPETLEVAKYARRHHIPVLALTGKTGSSLAQLADWVLDGSVEREACPLNLAPTSSTTLAMALGDALAVALMKARGFQERDFALYHPSGSLGRKLSLVRDHMREDLLVLKPDDDFLRILEVVTAHNYGIAAVVEDQQLIGAITDGDLRRALIQQESKVFGSTAEELMSRQPKRVADNLLAVDALQLMEDHRISALFVENAESKRLQGIVRMYDLLEAKVV
jgi:arabinose-5-phosphate isomerase